jgi:hypothetical protein
MESFFENLSIRGLSGVRLPREFGVSFLGVEEDEQNRTRIGLSYILKRVS